MRILEVDDEVGARIQIQVCVDLRLLSRVEALIGIRLPALVPSLTNPAEDVWHDFEPNGEEHVNDHSLHDLVANNRVPIRGVVVEGSLKERDSKLREVGVHKEDQDGRVEELSEEDTIGDGCYLLGMGIVADVGNPLDGLLSDQDVDNRDDHRDRVAGKVIPKVSI